MFQPMGFGRPQFSTGNLAFVQQPTLNYPGSAPNQFGGSYIPQFQNFNTSGMSPLNASNALLGIPPITGFNAGVSGSTGFGGTALGFPVQAQNAFAVPANAALFGSQVPQFNTGFPTGTTAISPFGASAVPQFNTGGAGFPTAGLGQQSLLAQPQGQGFPAGSIFNGPVTINTSVTPTNNLFGSIFAGNQGSINAPFTPSFDMSGLLGGPQAAQQQAIQQQQLAAAMQQQQQNPALMGANPMANPMLAAMGNPMAAGNPMAMAGPAGFAQQQDAMGLQGQQGQDGMMMFMQSIMALLNAFMGMFMNLLGPMMGQMGQMGQQPGGQMPGSTGTGNTGTIGGARDGSNPGGSTGGANNTPGSQDNMGGGGYHNNCPGNNPPYTPPSNPPYTPPSNPPYTPPKDEEPPYCPPNNPPYNPPQNPPKDEEPPYCPPNNPPQNPPKDEEPPYCPPNNPPGNDDDCPDDDKPVIPRPGPIIDKIRDGIHNGSQDNTNDDCDCVCPDDNDNQPVIPTPGPIIDAIQNGVNGNPPKPPATGQPETHDLLYRIPPGQGPQVLMV